MPPALDMSKAQVRGFLFEPFPLVFPHAPCFWLCLHAATAGTSFGVVARAGICGTIGCTPGRPTLAHTVDTHGDLGVLMMQG